MLDLRLLPVFVAVAEELHFSRAADRLHMAQPAVSQQIKRLEVQLGFPLLARTTRNVELTAAGEEFLSGAREAVKMVQEATSRAGETAVREDRDFTVGAAHVIGAGAVPTAISVFSQAHPSLRVRVLPGRTLVDPQIDVSQRRADVAFAWQPVVREGLVLDEVIFDPIWVALPAIHPAAALKAVPAEALADLANIGPWSDIPDAVVRRWAAPFLASRGAPPWGPETSTMPETMTVIMQGEGFLIVTAAFAALNAHAGVVYRPLVHAEPVGFGTVRRADDERPQVRSFTAAARRLLESYDLSATHLQERERHPRR